MVFSILSSFWSHHGNLGRIIHPWRSFFDPTLKGTEFRLLWPVQTSCHLFLVHSGRCFRIDASFLKLHLGFHSQIANHSTWNLDHLFVPSIVSLSKNYRSSAVASCSSAEAYKIVSACNQCYQFVCLNFLNLLEHHDSAIWGLLKGHKHFFRCLVTPLLLK